MNQFVIYQHGDLPVRQRQIRSSDIRNQCSSHKKRKPCFICGRHKSITEAHHTISLREISQLLASWESLPEPPIVWLCPNCHTYVHNYQRLGPSELEPGILEKIFEIQRTGEDFLNQYAKIVIAQTRQAGGEQDKRP